MVPPFIWAALALLVISGLLSIVTSLVWMCCARGAEKRSNQLSCTIDSKAAKSVPKVGPPAAPVAAAEALEKVRPASASGVVSINPIHMASGKTLRSSLIVVEPLGGDAFTESHL
jgi:hypothetical protein